MKEFVIFHKKIEEVLNNNFENLNNSRIYILLSIDEVKIYWLIKLDAIGLLENILDYFKFILPSGVKIIGVLKIGNIDDKEFNIITIDSYRKIKKFCIANELDIISLNFYSVVITKLDPNSERNSCIGLIYNPREGEEDKIILNDSFNTIKFENLDEYVHSEYFLVNSFINPIMVINKENVFINSAYNSSNIGLNFRDLNIIIPNASYLLENLKIKDKLKEEKEQLINKYQTKLNNLLNHKEREINETNCILLFNSCFTEEAQFRESSNTATSIFQEISEKDIIKSIKIYITCLFRRDSNLTILETSDKILKRYYLLIKELKKANTEKKEIMSLFTFYKPSIVPIPLGIFYSYDNNYEANEENLQTQRKYFHNLFNLPENKPIIKTSQLEKKFIELLRNQSAIELINRNKKNSQLAKNIHLNKIKLNKGKFIDGEYYYYHTGLNSQTDKNSTSGFRALQTYLSWFNLNGYLNNEIPSINEIKNLLVYLGHMPSKAINSNQNLNLNNLALLTSYYIDLNLEIISLKSNTEFKIILDAIEQNFKKFKLPLIVANKDSIYTIVGISEDYTKFLIINHEYSGELSSYKIIKSNVCDWINIDQLFRNGFGVEILFAKPNYLI